MEILPLVPYEELLDQANILQSASEVGESDEIKLPLDVLTNAVNDVDRSFSGSWLGYHSRVYYSGLQPSPPGENFSQEWGLQEMIASMGSRGDWCEFDPEIVIKHIFHIAENPSLDEAKKAAEDANNVFDSTKSEILSILTHRLEEQADTYTKKLKNDLENLKPMSETEIIRTFSPSGQTFTRDSLAATQGTMVPPHISVKAEIIGIKHTFDACKSASRISAKAASHLKRKIQTAKIADSIGTNVFIGHGRSSFWRELKDFIQDRLSLPWDEFNRVPIAGMTNTARLSEMLDAAAIAFLVLTAEDERADGGKQARMNVIHEAGLFQGKLGFDKAILLLEEGCQEFSNIQGLGQIRFPKGNIKASFEDVRRVLEREGVLGVDIKAA